jgi:hypothetical protein
MYDLDRVGEFYSHSVNIFKKNKSRALTSTQQRVGIKIVGINNHLANSWEKNHGWASPVIKPV